MKITNVKAMVAKMMTVGLLAGAVVMAAPAAQAQSVRFGVGINVPMRGGVYDRPVYDRPVYGGPVYAAPVYGYGGAEYGGPVYGRGYEREFYERRAAERRHEEWVRAHELRRDRAYGYYGR